MKKKQSETKCGNSSSSEWKKNSDISVAIVAVLNGNHSETKCGNSSSSEWKKHSETKCGYSSSSEWFLIVKDFGFFYVLSGAVCAGGVSSTFRDSKTAPFAWREKLTMDEVEDIQVGGDSNENLSWWSRSISL